MLQTQMGPVDLRRARRKIDMTTTGDQKTVTIESNWLKGLQIKKLESDLREKERRNRNADTSNEDRKLMTSQQKYRASIMQAIMVGAVEMERADTVGRVSRDPDTGLPRTAEQVARHSRMLEEKLAGFISGRASIPLRRLSVVQHVRPQSWRAQKYEMLKLGRKTGTTKRSWFCIDTGKLKVFKYGTDAARSKKMYSLSDDAECKYEAIDMPGLKKDNFWLNGYKARVKLTLHRERPHGPIYLMAEDDNQAKSWERAIKMSKYLQSASDREALKFVVSRLAGSIMNKGWQAMFAYAKELSETKQLVKNLAMRLMRVDLSRGWTKARAVYRQRVESEKLRIEQQGLAAQFLKERMERIGQQQARPPKVVRHGIISQIQTKFRHYRQEKIMDRAYPLGSSVSTRITQAQSGTTMTAAFSSLMREDALHLVLNSDSRILLQNRPEVFNCKKTTYSEVNVPLTKIHVNVSESFTMLSLSELDETADHEHLSKAGWAQFVNLDQISSVCLHSERQLHIERNGVYELNPALQAGVWFRINGPRVCWCRQARTYVNPKTNEVRKDVVGAANPLIVGSSLAKGDRLRWFKVAIQVQRSHVPRLHTLTEEEETFMNEISEEGDDGQSVINAKERQTFAVIHLLGRQFKSEKERGENPIYPGRFEAEVPISYDEEALKALDESMICIDIIECRETTKQFYTVYSGKMELWKVFGPPDVGPDREVPSMSPQEDIISLANTVSTSMGRAVKRVPFVHTADGPDPPVYAYMDIEVTARVQESVDPSKRFISPELGGKGPMTSLFTTHRGAWYDPKLGESRFNADRVANFVELAIKELNFPDTIDQNHVFKYHVVAKCNGVTQQTVQLCRARDVWRRVMPCEPKKLDWQGAKLYLPLPPGSWCEESVRPEIEIVIYRTLAIDDRTQMTLNFKELRSKNEKPGTLKPTYEPVYHATISLDGLQIDQVKDGARVAMSKGSAAAAVVNLATGSYTHVENNPAILIVDACLRDRDHVRLNMAHTGTSSETGQGCVLCVGDRAMMRVEEPLQYPQTELEWRRRCLPGSWDAGLAKQSIATGAGTRWSAPLREPSMSHEYTSSGMSKLDPAPPFKNRHLPTNCEDVIPSKYVLAQNELNFKKESRPGVYHRIINAQVDKSLRENKSDVIPDVYPPIVVDQLTHLVRHVPCTVLAVYANDLCDLEIAPLFVNEWERHEDRQYTIQGAVAIQMFQDISHQYIKNAPVGTGDVAERCRIRVMLRDVPMASLMGVQTGGFNVYNCQFGTVDDAIKAAPTTMGNDFNPRYVTDLEEPSLAAQRRGGYSLPSGPVPADAGPSCLYEWVLHCHAANEDDMYHFVTALRQSVRIDLHEQLTKWQDLKKKSALSATKTPYIGGSTLSTAAGTLEVVLVEARYLQAPHVVKEDMNVKNQWMAPNYHTIGIFSLRNGDEGEELVYRGSKTQISPTVTGNNPSWAKVDALQKSGGWVFKSPPIDPASMKDLFFEIEFKHKATAGMHDLGVVRVPINNHIHQSYRGHFQKDGEDKTEVVSLKLDGPYKGHVTYKGIAEVVKVDWNKAILFKNAKKEIIIDGYEDLEGNIIGQGSLNKSEGEFRLMPNLQTKPQPKPLPRGHGPHGTAHSTGATGAISTGDTEDGAEAMQHEEEHKILRTYSGTFQRWKPKDTEKDFPEVSLELEEIEGPQGIIITGMLASGLNECGVDFEEKLDVERKDREVFRMFKFGDPDSMEGSSMQGSRDIWGKVTGRGQLSRSGYGTVGTGTFTFDPEEQDDTLPRVNFCNTEEPFNNIWVPMHIRNKKTGKLTKSPNSKVHVMTFWVPQNASALTKRMPKKPREWRLWQLRPKFHANIIREHIPATVAFAAFQKAKGKENDGIDIQVNKRGYNPNNWQDTWPQSRTDYSHAHIEAIEDAIPYQDCCSKQDHTRWLPFITARFQHASKENHFDPTKQWSDVRDEWGRKPPDQKLAFERALRLGIPPLDRKDVWFELVYADRMKEAVHGGSEHAYRELAEEARVYKFPAVQQLAEDVVGASSWETSTGAALRSAHLKRVKRAQDVCLALIAFSMEGKAAPVGKMNYSSCYYRQESANGIAYTESLLVVAFYMLLATGQGEPDTPKGEEDEEHVFWMLATLTGYPGNRAFRDYWGTAPADPRMAQSEAPDLASRSGAMDDIRRLECCLARYEKEIWVQCRSLGLHLSVIFYGAFMRLFATYLPAISCFRFWDLIFSETTKIEDPPNPIQPPRHALIDLAFGVMKRCKDKFLEAKSAMEARDLVLDYLEHMYDPLDVVFCAATEEKFLWAKVGGHVEPLHVRDFARGNAFWEQHIFQFRAQNGVLKDLMLTQNRDPKTQLDTKKLNSIVKQARGQYMTEGVAKDAYMGMQRMAPPRLRRLGPDIDTSFVGSVTSWFSRISEQVLEDHVVPISISVPRPPELPEPMVGEPTVCELADFERSMSRIASIGQQWAAFNARLFQNFWSPAEKRLSINELLAALLCCSKGTVGEKAMALFNLYATYQPKHNVHHVNPTTHTAATVVEKIDLDIRATEGVAKRWVEPEGMCKQALHFKVYSTNYKGSEVLIGEVFVPTLRTFICESMDRDMFAVHPIWGLEKRLPPGLGIEGAARREMLDQHGLRQNIGDMYISIKWMPNREAGSETVVSELGQLGLCLQYIQFQGKYVEAPHKKNPRVTVVTYDENGEEVKIKRWDPRGGTRRKADYVTGEMSAYGQFGEYLEFQETMLRTTGTHTLRHHYFQQELHGWNADDSKWHWSKKFGNQYSTDKLKMRKELVKTTGNRPNTITLRACRLITKYLLDRSLHCLTNRQAYLISDQVFNRAGAVPGLLDALLVPADIVNPSVQSLDALKSECERARKTPVDVRHQVVLMHEETVDRRPGNINLFPKMGAQTNYTLQQMDIPDPFPAMKKVLWLRYIRAGDGERHNVAIPISEDGTFSAKDVPMEMDVDTTAGRIQMGVSKEEFVTCVLSTPLLSECLRQLTTNIVDTTGTDKEAAINLDISIADPTGEEEEEDMMDAINVRQLVTFEVWDYERAQRADFMGECTLPSLATLGEQPRTFVMEVGNAPEHDDPLLSRPDDSGRKRPKDKDGKPVQCTGNLHVEASWKCPCEDISKLDDSDDLQARVRKAEALHTGELHLKIIKATGLRRADYRRGADPYIWVHIRNECNVDSDEHIPGFKDGWRVGIHPPHYYEPVMKTSYKSGTLNPEWNEAKTITLQTGAFEYRSKRRGLVDALHSVGHAAKGGTYHSAKDKKHMDIIGGARQGSSELKVYFGKKEADLMSGQGGQARPIATFGQTLGYRHGVQVYLSDTIHQFKNKLARACRLEMEKIKDEYTDRENMDRDLSKKLRMFEALSKTGVTEGISYRHVVMVFVPSKELRELSQRGAGGIAYRSRYKMESADHSSWQPLDPVRSFSHYYAMYGFGQDNPQWLKINEGTDDYKLRNNRYRQFLEDQKVYMHRIEDLDTESECFGYAKYVHQGDGNSTEWRQVIIDRPLGPATGARKWKSWFMCSPGSAPVDASGVQGVPGQDNKQEIEWDSLLAAPAHPKLIGSASLEHLEFLAKASKLKEEEHLKEADIVERLNTMMDEKYKAIKHNEIDQSLNVGPPPITIADVQNAIKRDEEAVNAAKEPQSTPENRPPPRRPLRVSMMGDGLLH